MRFKNLSEISASIKKWQEVIKKSETALAYLNCGNMFTFNRTQNNCSNLHVYMGVFDIENDKELYAFLIDEKDDVKGKTDEYIFNAITQCRVKYDDSLLHSNEIPEKEARERMSFWDKDYIQWIENQITTPEGIFRAFNLPSNEIITNRTYRTFFSLKNNSDSKYVADLVTVDSSSKAHPIFYDTVRPVPPFDVLPESGFYLLTK